MELRFFGPELFKIQYQLIRFSLNAPAEGLQLQGRLHKNSGGVR